jgi:DNA mismatch endonuclease, patch repair protein
MADTLSRARRSALMSRIRAKNTRPEIVLRKSLRRLGIRYRSFQRIAGTTVDVVLPESRTVILVHGCFWHGCGKHYRVPKTRTQFWAGKITTNRVRDRRQLRDLRIARWRVVVIWEHSLRKNVETVVANRLKLRPTASGNRRARAVSLEGERHRANARP